MGPFETERLYLWQMETADIDALRGLIYSDEEVWGQYSGLGNNMPELESRFIYRSHQPKNDSFGRLVVVLKETSQVIGQVHLDPYVNDYGAVPGDPPSPCCSLEVELAFAFGKAYWGKGFAFEACQCLVKYAFETLKLPRLVGAAVEGNERSVKLQKRLGYEVFPEPDGGLGWVTVLRNPLLGHAAQLIPIQNNDASFLTFVNELPNQGHTLCLPFIANSSENQKHKAVNPNPTAQ